MRKYFIVMLLLCGLLYGVGVAGTSPSATYKRLLFLDSNEISSAYKEVADGAGNLAPFTVSSTGFRLTADKYLQFRDVDSYIYSPVTGNIGIHAGTAIDIITGTCNIGATGLVSIETTDAINGISIAKDNAVPVTIGKTGATSTVAGDFAVTGVSAFNNTVTLNETRLMAKLTAENSEIEGSNFDITGGTIDEAVTIGKTTPILEINVDNLKLDGNTISSTDTNGDINITPTGTGNVVIANQTVTGVSSLIGPVNVDAINISGAVKAETSEDFHVNTSSNIELDAEGDITIGTADSGTPITIGNTTSETTFGDNVTINGVLTVGETSQFGDMIYGDITSTKSVFTGIDVNGGAIDATIIGGITPAAGTFSTLSTTDITTLGNKLDTGGFDIILDSDGDTSISAGTVDDRIDISPGGVDEVYVGDGVVYPATSGGTDLGKVAARFNDLWLYGNAEVPGTIATGTMDADAATIGDLDVSSCDIDGDMYIGSSMLYLDGEVETMYPGSSANIDITPLHLYAKIIMNGTHAATIDNGLSQGQIKFIYISRETSSADVVNLEGTNVLGTLSFTDAGSSAVLFWDDTDSKWIVMSQNGCTFTP